MRFLCILFVVLTTVACKEKHVPFIVVGSASYSHEDVAQYATYFGYDDSIAEAKFVEYALLKEASATVPENLKEVEKLYYKLVTPVLYSFLKKESLKSKALLTDEYFKKLFILDYDFYLIPANYIKREHKKTVKPGDLPVPIDFLLAHAKIGDSFTRIETKHGFFDITVLGIHQGTPPSPDIQQTINNALAMALTFQDIKERHRFQFFPEYVSQEGSSEIVVSFNKTDLSVVDIEKATLLPVKFEERYHAMRYFGEMKLLEHHFAAEVRVLRKYCHDLARIKTYQDTYFKNHKDATTLLLGDTYDTIIISDGINDETIILFPDMASLADVKKDDVIMYNKKKMTVTKRFTQKTSIVVVEEYMLRQLFKELQSRISVKKFSP